MKYVTLKKMLSDDFDYPVPISDFYEKLREDFRETKGAVTYMQKLDYEKVLNDIGSSGGIDLIESSKGVQLVTFIMKRDLDKLEQLSRESYKDRPKAQIDFESLNDESTADDLTEKMKGEERKREQNEKLRARRENL